MKKLKTLSFAIAGVGLLLATLPLRPAFAESYVALDSTSVKVSTSMLSGATKLVSATNNPAYVLFWSTNTLGVSGESIAIADAQASVSTAPINGSFRFPVNTLFELRDFKGPIWAIVIGTTPINVSVLRKR